MLPKIRNNITKEIKLCIFKLLQVKLMEATALNLEKELMSVGLMLLSVVGKYINEYKAKADRKYTFQPAYYPFLYTSIISCSITRVANSCSTTCSAWG